MVDRQGMTCGHGEPPRTLELDCLDDVLYDERLEAVCEMALELGREGHSTARYRAVLVLADHTVTLEYNNSEQVKQAFAEIGDQIACIIMEPEKGNIPVDNFLAEVQDLCRKQGAVFILDEMITGFRWHAGGGQAYHDIQPDLSTFGKALGNGFSIAALVGKRELMELGGIRHDKERVFLLSLILNLLYHQQAGNWF